MSTVVGQDSVVRVMTAVAEGMRARLVTVQQRNGFDIQQYVQTQKLSGQVLNRRTGRLRNSINSLVQEGPGSVSAQVGTGVSYAKIHEYGFQGTVQVPAHTRMQTMAFGHPMQARLVNVRAHPMRVNLPERSFLRSSLREKAPEAIERIRVAVRELIEESRT
ncbi:MAG: hypothetical protein ACTHMK_13705 [Dyella sp.]|uniref:hypothetical protein n=1 Tax=Dyella sp. TaxID=1869338 RepID=UPI003F7EB107